MPAELELAHFVGGDLVRSEDEGRLDVVDPSEGRLLLTIPRGCEQDVNAAVVSARAAIETCDWELASPGVRKGVLHRFAALITRDAAILDKLDAEEMGKPVGLAAFDARQAAELALFYAEAADKIAGECYPSDAHVLAAQRLVPRGVVGAIVPWNFPTYNAVLKIAPALAAGNAVVLKPSEMASRSAVHLAALAVEAGLAPGLLNVVLGAGDVVGRALALHRQVDMIAFTGSSTVGRAMLGYSSQSNMKAVVAECGGKSPQIVFDDGVDLDEAAAAIAESFLLNQGQVCSIGTRLIVAERIRDPLIERLSDHAARRRIGSALDAQTNFGPLVSARQRERVLAMLDSARNDGATVQTIGDPASLPSNGHFVLPAIVSDVSPEHPIAQEEIFGPALTVLSAKDEAEAIRIANGTRFGLAAYVWTADLARGLRLAKAIKSTVIVNASAMLSQGPGHACSAEPWGESGFGVEGGLPGMESYMRRQLIWFNHR